MGTFKELVQGSKAGKREDVEHLLRIYQPLIEHQSQIDGKPDADLRQHLQLEFLLALMNFEIL